MRSSMNQQGKGNSNGELLHVDFHHFVEQEQQKTSLELADEFGLSLKEVKTLKKKLGRN